MAFVRIQGLKGRVYVAPASYGREKKHPCADCEMCQWCSDTRCRECLKRAACRRRKRKKGAG